MKVLKRYEENGKELVLAITPEGKKSIPYHEYVDWLFKQFDKKYKPKSK
jgi:hypothetical protein